MTGVDLPKKLGVSQKKLAPAKHKVQTKPVYADTDRRADVKLKQKAGASGATRFAHQPEWKPGVARKSPIHIAADTVDAGEKGDREWREEKKVTFHMKKHR